MTTDLLRRWLQFAQLAAGILIFTAGAAQAAFAHPFRKDRNRALLVLGIASVLYGIRLLANLDDFRALAGGSRLFWAYVDTYITYALLIPVPYFFELTFGAGPWQSVRWLRIVSTVYAVAAIVVDAVLAKPGAAKALNGYLVIAMILVVGANTVRVRALAGVRTIRIGLIVLSAFVLFQNIVNDRFLGGQWNVEWAGVLVLLVCLGVVAVSGAVDNDRRLHELRHELETARQIQTSILPQAMPVVSGVGLAARYLPMTAVAGDFYDFIDLGGGRFGLLVADVSGHGVPAALIASMVKVALLAQSPHADAPALVLSGMNQIFCGQLERQFVTAAYVYVDAAADRLRYAAAGHPPALLVSRDGTVDEIAENGVMLGHFPNWPYASIERAFAAGDRLILYTDGLIEASDAHGDFFDCDRLRAFAGRRSNGGADAFAGALVSHVREWSGRGERRGFDDDVTIVVVDRVPA